MLSYMFKLIEIYFKQVFKKMLAFVDYFLFFRTSVARNILVILINLLIAMQLFLCLVWTSRQIKKNTIFLNALSK